MYKDSINKYKQGIRDILSSEKYKTKEGDGIKKKPTRLQSCEFKV